MPYCSSQSPDGFYCVLALEHTGDHVSLDNRELWRGTPGKPVVWSAVVTETKAAKREKALSWGFTGEFCSNCGGANLRRAGTCMVCESCGTTTGCS